jgi:hypothetical protein
MRMFGPNGNPSAKNLFGVLAHLQAQEGVNFEIRPRPAAVDSILQCKAFPNPQGRLRNNCLPRVRDIEVAMQ